MQLSGQHRIGVLYEVLEIKPKGGVLLQQGCCLLSNEVVRRLGTESRLLFDLCFAVSFALDRASLLAFGLGWLGLSFPLVILVRVRGLPELPLLLGCLGSLLALYFLRCWRVHVDCRRLGEQYLAFV